MAEVHVFDAVLFVKKRLSLWVGERLDHAVGAYDRGVENRLTQRRRVANQGAVGIDAATGDTIEPLRNVEPFDVQRRRACFFGLQGLAAIAEAVFGELVAMTLDKE